MLQLLRIRNFALLEAADLEFEAGFTAVTGETGAGKSVLLGALAFLAGSRTDRAAIRQGADSCEVEAALHFANPAPINALLEALGLPLCSEGTLVLRRTFSRQKGSRIHINSALATLNALQELGEAWIDFHGPGEPQKLLHERCQLAMLDLYAGLESQLEEYGRHYRSWKSLLKEHEELTSRDHAGEDELAFLRGQIARIDAAAPSREAIEKLEADWKRFSCSREIVTLAAKLDSGLGGENDSLSARLAVLLRTARELAALDPVAGPLLVRLDSLAIEAGDLAAEFAGLAESADFDPAAATRLEEQMNRWLEVRRQYGPDYEAVAKRREALAKRVELQADLQGTLERLRLEAEREEGILRKLASRMRQKRQTAAAELAGHVTELLGALGFRRAVLKLEILPDEVLHEAGDCRARFLFSPNAGQEPLPLNRIASSGEMARVMLALKAILAQVDATPLLVFDEVDANVGGEIGAAVGRELSRLSGSHQVLCVTHLPQVAASATSHLLVTKEQSETQTHVSIRAITEEHEGRVRELARMLGDRNAESALRHAEALLMVPA